MAQPREPETGKGLYTPGQRHAQVVTPGPRIAALPNDEIDDAVWAMVDTVREAAGVPPAAEMPVFMRLMAKHPRFLQRQMEMGTVLFTGRISPRERELAVLRISWLAGAAVEWDEHVEIAKRLGLSGEDIERITQGSSAAAWSEHEAAILRAVEELLADFAISDETWAVLARSWDEQQLIELPMMAGQYLTTAFLLNTLRVQLGPTNKGLDHR